MRRMEFFRQVPHTAMPWHDQELCMPAFYYDATALDVQFLASTAKVKALLPSPRMVPLRVTPWHCAVFISALQYRDSDVGPYNEVLIGIPVTLDRPSPLFTGMLRSLPEVPALYVRHLPVTTVVARDAGNEWLGTAKIVATIEIEEDDTWFRCHLAEGQEKAFTLEGRKSTLRPEGRHRYDLISVRDGYMLRWGFTIGEHQASLSRSSGDVRLVLGEHPIAQDLRRMGLGRMVSCQYIPSFQAILSPVVESIPVLPSPRTPSVN